MRAHQPLVLALLTIAAEATTKCKPQSQWGDCDRLVRGLNADWPYPSSAKSQCSWWLATTVTPCPVTTTVTKTTTSTAHPVTATISKSTELTSTFSTVTTTTDTITTETSTEHVVTSVVTTRTFTTTDTVTATVITTENPLLKRAADAAHPATSVCTTHSSWPTNLPPWASCCGNGGSFWNACQCAGIKPTTTTLPPSTVSKTVTSTVTVAPSTTVTAAVTGTTSVTTTSTSTVDTTAFTTISVISTTIIGGASIPTTTTVTTTTTSTFAPIPTCDTAGPFQIEVISSPNGYAVGDLFSGKYQSGFFIDAGTSEVTTTIGPLDFAITGSGHLQTYSGDYKIGFYPLDMWFIPAFSYSGGALPVTCTIGVSNYLGCSAMQSDSTIVYNTWEISHTSFANRPSLHQNTGQAAAKVKVNC